MATFDYLNDYEWASDFTIENEIGQSCPPDEIDFLDWNSLGTRGSTLSPSQSTSSHGGSGLGTGNGAVGGGNGGGGELSLNSYLDTSRITSSVSNDKSKLGEIKDIETLALRLSAYLETARLTEFHIEELMQLIVGLLNDKSKPHSHLESELMDLLGFGAIDLIREIIQNHQLIVKSHKSLYQESFLLSSTTTISDQIGDPAMEALAKLNSLQTSQPKKPSITQSVVVQTMEEKNLKKYIRKCEKKMMKEINKEANENDTTDINKIKQEKERQLLEAMSGPLFKRTAPMEREKYPFVFDNYAEAQLSAAFICGAKMALPAGFKRNDNPKWEEIEIPPCSKIPPDFLPEFGLIDVEKDLDPLGRKVFAGFKKLNKVQSIVYNTACNTNNNMLICAPTGAGKTNIAMLTILNELRRHCDPETLMVTSAEEFKIIYIAPMKALASEMTDGFSKRLKPLGVRVKELTGDMQLSKAEIIETHMIITTPEKWDVVTRKPKGEVELMKLVKLLVIDEVHLLQSDRGPVVEALVARTLRHVESTQSMIRIVGLSATLPNYVDVASFLNVNLREGLFFFDDRFRPVPLGQTFIGIKSTFPSSQMNDMDEICYEKVHHFVSRGQQCMVFVHARNATYKTAEILKENARAAGHLELFRPEMSASVVKAIERPNNGKLKDLLKYGLGVHHAGLTRPDRNLVEKLFKEGVVKVLVCTSTLAWGVNLPAHAVIIRGTELYDPAQGNYVQLDVLDVMQIFGRAGRPQYDKEGFATIITTHDKLRHYLTTLTCQFPIESQFMKCCTDHLNAEVVLGTVTTIDEAVEWLGYTYFFVRMKKNPLVYGITHDTLINDPGLFNKRRDMIIASAMDLDRARMVRYDETTGCLDPTDLGRTASHYYIKYKTIEIFNQLLSVYMMEDAILNMISNSQEFDQLKSREEEMDELAHLNANYTWLKVGGSLDDKNGKTNILIQAYLSHAKIEQTSLTSDMLYIVQNSVRILRGLFEYVLRRGFASLAHKFLSLSKMLEKEMWSHETPFQQFSRSLSHHDLDKIQRLGITVNKIKSDELSTRELANMLRVESKGILLKKLAYTLPCLDIEATLQPITRTVIRVTLHITPSFNWDDSYNGKKSEPFWIWMQDADSQHIYHHEFFKVTKKQAIKKETQTLVFTIPLLDPDNLPSHYIIHSDSDRWLGCDREESIPCFGLVLPEKVLPFTKLLDLNPLPISALKNDSYESLFKFTHFNPIQTQLFHTLYHTDNNVLLGAPTGSGKTNCAEIAIFRAFNVNPECKIVYIAPLKALVRERVNDWKVRLGERLNKPVVELTGDFTPDVKSIMSAKLIVTTPEKWDGISRSWQTRQYVRDVCLIIIDEIHLLGEDRGPVLEVIVSRTNFINSHTGRKIRLIGLSTAVANAQDLANWLGIEKIGLYNFRPSVRPVPLEVHVSGYPGKHYCPRMASMNKPTFKAVKQHSPDKPVIVFVSSRRQTRLTALDLIAYLAMDNPKQWVHMTDEENNYLIQNNIKDSNLKLTLAFGIGLHHAGLHEKDRSLVEELFLNQKIQVLITTATLAWGVNLPAHLVIIKGTEFYDGKIHRYVDFPITDVLQMMGRAGRPQFDKEGIAVILVHDIKKEFYKKFLYEPFPVESHLIPVIEDHVNAEIVAGTLSSKSDCVEYLSWTYLFRRLFKNPSYYEMEGADLQTINHFLSQLTDRAVNALEASACVEVDPEDDRTLYATPLGRIASFYYLNHKTVKMFQDQLSNDIKIERLLHILTSAAEYNELPVRHNEDLQNEDLAKRCRFPVTHGATFDCSHTKAYLLLQAHFSRLELPSTDYYTDTKSVLDQAIRIIQAMIDISAMNGYLTATLGLISILQMIIQARWYDCPSYLTLPHVDEIVLPQFKRHLSIHLPELMSIVDSRGIDCLIKPLDKMMDIKQIRDIYQTINGLPFINLKVTLKKAEDESDELKVTLDLPDTSIKSRHFIELEADTDYLINFNFERSTRSNYRPSRYIYAPKYAKPKDENWILIVGDSNTKELIALKRSGYIGNKLMTNSLIIRTPERYGRAIYSLYFLSDALIGLDQQYDLGIDVIPRV